MHKALEPRRPTDRDRALSISEFDLHGKVIIDGGDHAGDKLQEDKQSLRIIEKVSIYWWFFLCFHVSFSMF